MFQCVGFPHIGVTYQVADLPVGGVEVGVAKLSNFSRVELWE